MLEYNGDPNITAYPGLSFPLANVSLGGAPYQGLLFPANTHPGKNFSLASYDLIWDRIVAAVGTGAVSAFSVDLAQAIWLCFSA